MIFLYNKIFSTFSDNKLDENKNSVNKIRKIFNFSLRNLHSKDKQSKVSNDNNLEIREELDSLNKKVDKRNSLGQEYYTLDNEISDSYNVLLNKCLTLNNLYLGKIPDKFGLDILDLLSSLPDNDIKFQMISLLNRRNEGGNIDMRRSETILSLKKLININNINRDRISVYENTIQKIDSIEFNNVSTSMNWGVRLINQELYGHLYNAKNYKHVLKPGNSEKIHSML